MRRPLVLLALLSLSHIALAAEVRLGTEIALGTPSLGPAPGIQQILSVATNGRDFLALWSDSRQTLPIAGSSSQFSLYVGRVDASGHPVDPVGHKLVDRATGQLVAVGTTYFVVYTTLSGHSFLQVLDSDGNFAGMGVELPIAGAAVSAVSNGRNIALVHTAEPDGVVLSLFNVSGTRIRSNIALPLNQPARLFVLPNGDYGLIATHFICPGNVPCHIETTLITLDGTTGEMTEKPLADLQQWATIAGVAGSDGHILLTWIQELQEGRTAYYELLDASGNVVVPPVQIATEPLKSISYAHRPSAGWDGHEFLVTLDWPSLDERTGALLAYRVSATGQLIDTSPIVLDTHPADPPQFATGAAGTFVAWDSAPQYQANVYARTAHNFDDLAAAPTTLLAQAAVLQLQPRLAPGFAPYATWREGNEGSNVTGSLVGGAPSILAPQQQPPVAPAAVARGGQSFLVVWTEPLTDGGFRVLAKRVAFSGTPIDATPIAIAENPNAASIFSVDDYAVGSDGTNFLVVWEASPGLKGARVSPAGKVLDAQPIELDRNPYGFYGVSPRVAWSGTRYLVAWYDTRWALTLISPPLPPSAELRVASVSASGEVLDSGATPQIGSTNNGGELALAASGDGALLVFSTILYGPSSQECAFSVPLRSDGTPAAPIHPIIECGALYPQSTFVNPDVAWDGKNFVAVWSDPTTTNVDALRFDAAGNPIDDAPFTVNPAGTTAVQPAVAASASGVSIAYVRVADEPPYGGVARIFARTLERIGGTGRFRVVR